MRTLVSLLFFLLTFVAANTCTLADKWADELERQTRELLDSSEDESKKRVQEDPQVSSLMKAIYIGDVRRAELLMKKGVDVNRTNKKGETPLMWAVDLARGNKNTESDSGIKIIGLLLKKRAQVDQKDNEGRTALMRVAESDVVTVANMLLDNHAKIDQKDPQGNTAFRIAVTRNNLKMAEFLLSKGADIDTKNDTGETALMETYFSGQEEKFKMLVKNGAVIETNLEKKVTDTLPTYKVVREEQSKVDVNSHVDLNVIVQEPVSKEQLNKLLNDLYQQTLKGPEGKKPNIAIRVYRRMDQAKTGDGMLAAIVKTEWGGGKPTTTFYDDFIKASQRPSMDRFGLTEAQRIKIFQDYTIVERHWMDIARARHPHDAEEQDSLREELLEKNAGKLAKREHITRSQLSAINSEGSQWGWPLPEYKKVTLKERAQDQDQDQDYCISKPVCLGFPSEVPPATLAEVLEKIRTKQYIKIKPGTRLQPLEKEDDYIRVQDLNSGEIFWTVPVSLICDPGEKKLWQSIYERQKQNDRDERNKATQ